MKAVPVGLALLISIIFAKSDIFWVDHSTKCTANYCDFVTPLNHVKDFVSSKDCVMYQTSRDNGDKLSKYKLFFSSEVRGGKHILLDRSQVFQVIIGFGGALTDSVALTLAKLDKEMQNLLLSNYYSENGIEYSTARVPMASSDFSLGVYSYCDVKGDYLLENFSVDIDRSSYTGRKLSLIKQVVSMFSNVVPQNETGQHTNQLKLFASPWAPPAWMTESNSTIYNPTLRDEPKVYQAWALYFSKFFNAYHKEGVTFWGVTTQNEPMGNTGAWQDLRFSATQMLHFIKHYLGPGLRSSHPHLKIIVLDDQRTHLPDWTSAMLKDKAALKFIDGNNHENVCVLHHAAQQQELCALS